MGCLGVGAAFGVLLVMGQLCMAVHGGRPGRLQPISTMSSTGHETRKLSGVFEEVFQRPRPLYPLHGRGDHLVDWDLRKVPSGPDPLHHHNGGPRKPETP